MKKSIVLGVVLCLVMFFSNFVGSYAYVAEPQWVLVKVIDFPNTEQFDVANKSEVYHTQATYGRGAYGAVTEYIGDTDTYYNPPTIHGESLTIQANWTIPPSSIKKDQVVSLNLTLSAVNNQSAFKFGSSSAAWLGNTRLVTKDNKSNFEITFNNQYATQNQTVTTVLGTGTEGQQKVIELNFYCGLSMYTQYVYEWSSTKVPISPTLPVVKPQPVVVPTTVPTTVPAPQLPPDSKYKDTGLRFSDLGGEVIIRHDDEDVWELAEMDTIICERDHIKTAYNSGAVIAMTDMTTFLMKEDSEVIAPGPVQKDSKIDLVLGNIYINAKKMILDGTMEVEMSQAVAGIKGTTFVLNETGSASTLMVLEGIVQFTSKKSGTVVAVSAGEMAVADATGTITKSNLNINTEAKKWDKTIIELLINNKLMKVNGVLSEIDPGRMTVPVILNKRTLIPIRAVFEALGGTVGYQSGEKKILLTLGDKKLEMWIDKTALNMNNVAKTTDVAPVIMDGRTMVPLRFVVENFGFEVQWKATEKKIVIQ